MTAGADIDGERVPAAEALCRWAEARFGGEVTLVEPPTSNGSGFDSDIHYVHLTGDSLPPEWRAPLVLRVKPSDDRLDIAHYEEAVQGWLADRGFPTPRILVVIEPGPVTDRPTQVMERVTGGMALDAVLHAPWRAPALVRRLARLQARIHRLDPAGFPESEDLLDKRLRLTRATADVLDDRAMSDALARIEQLAEELRDAPAAVCHGDFHPLNVLVDGEDMAVIDWTDSGIGDRHGDVARTLVLFSIASIAASSAVERVALRFAGPVLGRIYRRAYERELPLDDRRLGLWTPVHLLHGWSQARGVTDGVFGDGDTGVPTSERVDLALVAALHDRFDRAIAAVS